MYTPTEKEIAEVNEQFTYHSPFGDQPERYQEIRAKAKDLALTILRCVPLSADRQASLRKLRESVMTANAGIAVNEKPFEQTA